MNRKFNMLKMYLPDSLVSYRYLENSEEDESV